jgi:Uma2 family endonuclease
MSSIPDVQGPGETGRPVKALPPLREGERLDQPTFHERYLAMPEGTRAELIGGVVHMPSPAKRPHGRSHGSAVWVLKTYELSTPGTEAYDNASNLMGPESEPQPDGCLLIVPELGGQISVKDDWLVGAPELIVEVSDSTERVDLQDKKADYEKCGVQEYVVLALRQRRAYWFRAREGGFVEVPPGPDGIYRSEVFSGLWLDAAALIAGDMARVQAVLAQGLGSPEHAAFVAALAARRTGPA